MVPRVCVVLVVVALGVAVVALGISTMLLACAVQTGTLQNWITFSPHVSDFTNVTQTTTCARNGGEGTAFLKRAVDVRVGTIHAWYVLPDPNDASRASLHRRAVRREGEGAPKILAESPNVDAILFLHGRGGNLATCGRMINLFSRLGVPMLAMDYSGYGQSLGRPSETQTYVDAEHAVRWLRRLGHRRVVVVGYSLGGAVAVHVAAAEPTVVAGAVLMATFAKLEDVMPRPMASMCRGMYPSARRLENGEVKAPIMVMHSRDDEIVPYRSARAMFDAAQVPAKEFVDIVGPHTNPTLDDALLTHVNDFLRNVEAIAPHSHVVGAGVVRGDPA